ncbi:MAG: EutN/CcmL family microcompartment protein [Candidatus Omnitrophica bacterium]|nr:EutN/CcmL family microcompartment protein [Candidatus Omnitrophota bacterium]
MFLAKVVGTVVATQKDPKLAGLKLLLVQHLSLDLEPTKSFVVAADSVGSGTGEVVVCATGSSARLTEVTDKLPVDAVIMAIVDTLEINGAIKYSKSPEAASVKS